MADLDAYVFGHRVIYPEEGGEARLANALLRLGICAESRGDGGFTVREADVKRFVAYAGGRVRYTLSEPLGLPARIARLKHRIPTLISTVLSILLVVFLSSLVWDVRIDGAEDIPYGDISDRLADVGLSVGTPWRDVDPEKIEVALLDAMEGVSWVQINRRGVVAYVTVQVRREENIPKKSPYACSNIVADFDGVIEEISVERGRAVVKPGDVVRRGDILISGVVETEGGAYLAAARGSVRAEVAGSADATAGCEEVRDVLRPGGLAQMSLSLFSLKINIFKKYRNTPEDCVIIENEKEYLTVFGKRLPISVTRAYSYFRDETTDFHPKEELPTVAAERLWHSLRRDLAEADIIKLKSFGEYTDGGYVFRVDYVASREIGEEREIILTGASAKAPAPAS